MVYSPFFLIRIKAWKHENCSSILVVHNSSIFFMSTNTLLRLLPKVCSCPQAVQLPTQLKFDPTKTVNIAKISVKYINQPINWMRLNVKLFWLGLQLIYTLFDYVWRTPYSKSSHYNLYFAVHTFYIFQYFYIGFTF